MECLTQKRHSFTGLHEEPLRLLSLQRKPAPPWFPISTLVSISRNLSTCSTSTMRTLGQFIEPKGYRTKLAKSRMFEETPKPRRRDRFRTIASRYHTALSPWPKDLITGFWKTDDPSEATADEEEYLCLVKKVSQYIANHCVAASSTSGAEDQDIDPSKFGSTSPMDLDSGVSVIESTPSNQESGAASLSSTGNEHSDANALEKIQSKDFAITKPLQHKQVNHDQANDDPSKSPSDFDLGVPIENLPLSINDLPLDLIGRRHEFDVQKPVDQSMGRSNLPLDTIASSDCTLNAPPSKSMSIEDEKNKHINHAEKTDGGGDIAKVVRAGENGRDTTAQPSLWERLMSGIPGSRKRSRAENDVGEGSAKKWQRWAANEEKEGDVPVLHARKRKCNGDAIAALMNKKQKQDAVVEGQPSAQPMQPDQQTSPTHGTQSKLGKRKRTDTAHCDPNRPSKWQFDVLRWLDGT